MAKKEMTDYDRLMIYHNDLLEAYSEQMENPDSNVMDEYLEDVLDTVVLSDIKHQYKHCELVIGYGNPNVYVCTREQVIEYWNGGKKCQISIPDVVCRWIDDYMADVFNIRV